MCKVICVTNKKLCDGDFLNKIDIICRAKPDAIVLREKELDEKDYEQLAIKVMEICNKYGVKCILHFYSQVAAKLGCKSFHAPLFILEKMTEEERQYFDALGASCHSLDEVKKAQNLGCTYIFAGHIFVTDCKKGLEPRGLEFLQDVCKYAKIPVYAIGGIDKKNAQEAVKAGAKGVCIMSGFMKSQQPDDIVEEIRK